MKNLSLKHTNSIAVITKLNPNMQFLRRLYGI